MQKSTEITSQVLLYFLYRTIKIFISGCNLFSSRNLGKLYINYFFNRRIRISIITGIIRHF